MRCCAVLWPITMFPAVFLSGLNALHLSLGTLTSLTSPPPPFFHTDPLNPLSCKQDCSIHALLSLSVWFRPARRHGGYFIILRKQDQSSSLVSTFALQRSRPGTRQIGTKKYLRSGWLIRPSIGSNLVRLTSPSHRISSTTTESMRLPSPHLILLP